VDDFNIGDCVAIYGVYNTCNYSYRGCNPFIDLNYFRIPGNVLMKTDQKLFVIEYFPAAQKDLQEVITYIAQENPNAALEILNEFDQIISKLSVSPLLGEIPKHVTIARLGYRFLSIKNYLVFYLIKDERIEIRRIVHGWKSWGKMEPYPAQGLLSHDFVIATIRDNIKIQHRK
jgi:plasmid stabilization system protein ParE